LYDPNPLLERQQQTQYNVFFLFFQKYMCGKCYSSRIFKKKPRNCVISKCYMVSRKERGGMK
jgi:hypothetical protein